MTLISVAASSPPTALGQAYGIRAGGSIDAKLGNLCLLSGGELNHLLALHGGLDRQHFGEAVL